MSNDSLASIPEIKRFIELLHQLPKDDNLAYSLTNNLIDFFSQHYHGKGELDENVMNAFSDMFSSDHDYIRERTEKAILKLMIKNYRIIRKYLLIKLNDQELPEQNRNQIEKLIQSAFSPIYFDYSKISEAKAEMDEEPKDEMDEEPKDEMDEEPKDEE